MSDCAEPVLRGSSRWLLSGCGAGARRRVADTGP